MAIDGDIVAAIAERLAEHAGLELPPWLVEARVTNRLAALSLSPARYVELISSMRGGCELDRLTEAVRVGESRLFRHRAQINALVAEVVPQLRARRRSSLKIWSAGCSTGEEPYTLAAVLSQELPSVSLSILATDLSAEALEIARGARYPRAVEEHIPANWRDAFEIDDDTIRVRPEVTALVTFERANLLDDAPSNFDLVWCRNVLIYFTKPARQAVIHRLVAATVPGGFVFVGASEHLRDAAGLRTIRSGDALYYVREESAAAPQRAAVPAGPRAPRIDPRVEVHSEVTPPPTRIPTAPPPDEILVLAARPSVRDVSSALSERLAIVGLRRLVVDLDPAELLDDAIAPVLSRARAAARAANIELVLKTTRPGTRRWLARHALDAPETAPQVPE